MDVTLLPPTNLLSNHSHLSLLPSPFSPTHLRRPRPYNIAGYTPSAHPNSALNSTYRPEVTKRRSLLPCPPALEDGRNMFDQLPDELVTHIFSFLDWDESLQVRPVSKRWSSLALSPSLYHSLSLLSLPPYPLPETLRHILRHIRHLHLHLFPYPSSNPGTPGSTHPTTALLALLDAIPPDQLISLSLPFSAPYLPGSDLGEVLKRIGTRLQRLDLRGSGLVGSKWTEWIKHVGKHGQGLKSLDLSFTSISTLPGCPAPTSPLRPFRNPLTTRTATPLSPSRSTRSSPPSEVASLQRGSVDPFRNLKNLSLSSCAYLSEGVLSAFLASLPSSLERLDVSRLEVIAFDALWNMKVVQPAEEDPAGGMWIPDHSLGSTFDGPTRSTPTDLSELKVVGIDHLTRLDIRRLKHHWEAQKRACFPPPPPSATPPRAAPLMPWKTPKTPPATSRGGPPSPPATPSPRENSRKSPRYVALGISDGTRGFTNDIGPLHPFNRPVHGLPTPPPDSSSSSSASSSEDESSRPNSIGGSGSRSGTHSEMDIDPPSDNEETGEPGLAGIGIGIGLGFGEELEEKSVEDQIKINVIHSAILESEDVDGYRRFIGEVAGGVVLPHHHHHHHQYLPHHNPQGSHHHHHGHNHHHHHHHHHGDQQHHIHNHNLQPPHHNHHHHHEQQQQQSNQLGLGGVHGLGLMPVDGGGMM